MIVSSLHCHITYRHQVCLLLLMSTIRTYCAVALSPYNQRLCLLQLLSSTGTWYISSGSSAGDKERLATIKKDMYNNTHSASAFLQANTSQHFAQPVPDYSARGDLNNRSFFIYRGTAPVAEVLNMSITCSMLHCMTELAWHAVATL